MSRAKPLHRDCRPAPDIGGDDPVHSGRNSNEPLHQRWLEAIITGTPERRAVGRWR